MVRAVPTGREKNRAAVLLSFISKLQCVNPGLAAVTLNVLICVGMCTVRPVLVWTLLPFYGPSLIRFEI